MSNPFKASEQVEQHLLFPEPWDITESLLDLLRSLEKDFYKPTLLNADMLGLGYQLGIERSIEFQDTKDEND